MRALRARPGLRRETRGSRIVVGLRPGQPDCCSFRSLLAGALDGVVDGFDEGLRWTLGWHLHFAGEDGGEGHFTSVEGLGFAVVLVELRTLQSRADIGALGA